MAPARQTWSTQYGFLVSAVGAALGLGDLWRFPYLMLHYGGGAFLLVYLLCLCLAGVPVLIAELALGRRGAADPVTGLRHLAWHDGRSLRWSCLGWLAAATGLIVLALYTVVGGWAVAWLGPLAAGTIPPVTDHAGGLRLFAELVADPVRQVGGQLCFLLPVAVAAAAGLRGVEWAMRRLVPLLIGLLLLLAVYAALTSGRLGQALVLMFRPDFSRLGLEGLVAAATQACFTLSLGCGVMLLYGSGLSRPVSLVRSAVTVALVDTGMALVAAMATIPVLLAGRIEPGEGVSLAFINLPLAYGGLPWGPAAGAVFLACLALAALTSALALLQPMVESLAGGGWSRSRAAIVASCVVLGLSTAAALSVGLEQQRLLDTRTVYDWLSSFGAEVLLPLSWLALVVFAGWAVSRRGLRTELGIPRRSFVRWRRLIRYIVPGLLLASLALRLL